MSRHILTLSKKGNDDMKKISSDQAEAQIFDKDKLDEKVAEANSTPAPSQLDEYAELVKRMEELKAKMAAAKDGVTREAVAKIKAIAFNAKLTQQDFFSIARELPSDGSPIGSVGTAARERKSTAGTVVAPKYRDPTTGQTWTGRGKPPKWIANFTKEERIEKFSIE